MKVDIDVPDWIAERFRTGGVPDDFATRAWCVGVIVTALEEANQIWVYDGSEDRCWGPFVDDDDANEFIASDKYLESWCSIGRPIGTRYRPAEYHGRWPL